MMNKMKKLLGALFGLGAVLTYALPAFAQTTINPCSGLAGGGFGDLCNYNASNLGQIVSTAVVILLVIAVIISLFFLIWGGIRWITSGGDKAKVAEARSHIIAAIVGLVIAFLAFFILTIVLNLFHINIQTLSLPQLP